MRDFNNLLSNKMMPGVAVGEGTCATAEAAGVGLFEGIAVVVGEGVTATAMAGADALQDTGNNASITNI